MVHEAHSFLIVEGEVLPLVHVLRDGVALVLLSGGEMPRPILVSLLKDAFANFAGAALEFDAIASLELVILSLLFFPCVVFGLVFCSSISDSITFDILNSFDLHNHLALDFAVVGKGCHAR